MRTLLPLALAVALALPAAAQPQTAVALLDRPPEEGRLGSGWADEAVHLVVEADTPGPHPAILYLTRVQNGAVYGTSLAVETVAYGAPDPAALARRLAEGATPDGWDAYLDRRRSIARHVRDLFPMLGPRGLVTYDGRAMGAEEEVRALVARPPEGRVALGMAEALAPDHAGSGAPLIVLFGGLPEGEARAWGLALPLHDETSP